MTLAKMRVDGAVAAMRKEIMLATDPRGHRSGLVPTASIMGSLESREKKAEFVAEWTNEGRKFGRRVR